MVADGQAQCSPSGQWSNKYWYEEIEHNGESSFLQGQFKDQYTVFRNVVKDYGADNTGSVDAGAAIQAAIDSMRHLKKMLMIDEWLMNVDGPKNGPSRNSHSMGSTGQPAIIYLPGGTYLLERGLQLYIGTVIVGDPKNPPVLKAPNNFGTDHIVYAKDPNFGGTINFYIGIKNVVIDSTSVDPNRRMVLLDWTVSQATQLTNVVFRMPQGAEGHVGMTTEFDYNSNIILVSC